MHARAAVAAECRAILGIFGHTHERLRKSVDIVERYFGERAAIVDFFNRRYCIRQRGKSGSHRLQ